MTTTLAMPVVLDGPLPAPLTFCLLSSPGVVVPGEGHWLAGAKIYPYPVDEPQTWDPCSVGTFRAKSEGTGWPLPAFSPFVIYMPITCSSISIGDPIEFRTRAEIALEAVESYAVEQALSQGVDQSPNPFFLDGNEDLPAGIGAVKPLTALAYLEDAIGASGRKGMIHATPGVAVSWGIAQRDTPGPALTTKTGTPVIVGGGYQGAHQLGHTTPPAGQAWAFATGPVQVRLSDADLLDISEVLDRAENIVTFRAERYVLAVWDTAVQTAVLVDYTL